MKVGPPGHSEYQTEIDFTLLVYPVHTPYKL